MDSRNSGTNTGGDRVEPSSIRGGDTNAVLRSVTQQVMAKMAKNQGVQTYPMYQTCGKRHLGECRAERDFCYQCGRLGHMAQVCPRPPIQVPALRPYHKGYQTPCGGQQRNIALTRVYALMSGDAEVVGDVVTSIFATFLYQAVVLFDTGATHSFVSTGYAKLAKIEA
ncbi:uncharacterized protein LOC131156002 [Malania oleifera]|uniref:uncharacterized protein LOC131156002 n=1 Tax=Malania oleifera TaxID=397392 RepID=UPI0025ADF448|nr:uncharacterized protein LOC131156002 [Malania oleifera]